MNIIFKTIFPLYNNNRLKYKITNFNYHLKNKNCIFQILKTNQFIRKHYYLKTIKKIKV
jgi:hypothetical protein